MNSAIQGFLALPRPAQIALGILGVSTFSLAALIDWRIFVAMTIGLLLIGGVIWLFRALKERRQKRKADPFERELRESSGSVPQKVSKAAQRAQLDEMRKRFEEGIAIYREHGKDLYRLPWYVIIGEPKAGKTKAIERSGIRFPPKLKKELQGTGGTINMDWWFTDDAVILDTAGRYSVGEIDGTDTREWREFLKLLARYRPDEPINGLLIALPVDKLISDDAATIEHKGGRLAQKLDEIQSILGVRFPVYVLLTKTDFLVGFEQFFSDLRQADPQAQVIGWTNPESIDQPFDPARITEYLEDLRRNIVRRRYFRLLDDTGYSGGTPEERVTDVCELYSLPEQFKSIVPNIRRCLELIFAGGEWSSKQVFLRGIYFTSSMKEGAALDNELAKALGVSATELQRGEGEKRDRALFLRDLFLQKVFPEKGLVTHAPEAVRQMRFRKRLLYGAAAAALFILFASIVWSWFNYRDLDREIESWSGFATQHTGLRDAITSGGNRESEIVHRREDGSYEYWKMRQFDEDARITYDAERTRGETLLDVSRIAGATVSTPVIFYPPAKLTGATPSNLFEPERRDAARVLFEQWVVLPLVQAAAERINSTGGDAIDVRNDSSIVALANLVDVQVHANDPAQRSSGDDATAGARPWFDVEAMLKFVLDDESPTDVPSDEAAQLQEVADWLYASTEWPPPPLRTSGEPELRNPILSGDVTRAVNTGVEQFIAASSRLVKGEGAGALGHVQSLVDALRRFDESERRLLELAKSDSVEHSDWNQRFAAVSESYSAVNSELQQATVAETLSKYQSLAQWWREHRARLRDQLERAYVRLDAAATRQPYVPGQSTIAAATGDDSGDGSESASISARLRIGWNQIDRLLAAQDGGADASATADDLEAIDRLFMQRKMIAGRNARLFELRHEMYETANAQLALDDSTSRSGYVPGDVARHLAEKRRVLQSASERIAGLDYREGPARTAPPGEEDTAIRRAALADKLSRILIVDQLAAVRHQRREAHRHVEFLRTRNSVDAIASAVNDRAADHDPFELESVPLSALRSQSTGPAACDPQYHPDAAGDLLLDWALVRQILPPGESEPFARSVENYAVRYLDYWSSGGDRTFFALLLPDEPPSWAEFKNSIRGLLEEEITKKLQSIATETIPKALRKVPTTMDDLKAYVNPVGDPDRQAFASLRDPVAKKIASSIDAADEASLNLRTCGKVFSNWKSLAEETSLARQALLSAVQRGDKDEYVYARSEIDGVDEFVDRWWSEFSFHALVRLARQAQEDALKAMEELERYKRFPLGPVSPRGQLTLEEVQAAREEVRTILSGAAEAPPEGGRGSGADRRVGQPRFDDLLATLANPLPDDSKSGDVRLMGEMADALLPPGRARSLSASVVFLPQGTDLFRSRTEDRPADPSVVWGWVEIEQGTPYGFDPQPLLTEQHPTMHMSYPDSDPISIRFFNYVKESENAELTEGRGLPENSTPRFDGPWAVLALIHEYGPDSSDYPDYVTFGRRKDNNQIHDVEVRLRTEGGRDVSLWLRMTLEKPLPDHMNRLWQSGR